MVSTCISWPSGTNDQTCDRCKQNRDLSRQNWYRIWTEWAWPRRESKTRRTATEIGRFSCPVLKIQIYHKARRLPFSVSEQRTSTLNQMGWPRQTRPQLSSWQYFSSPVKQRPPACQNEQRTKSRRQKTWRSKREGKAHKMVSFSSRPKAPKKLLTRAGFLYDERPVPVLLFWLAIRVLNFRLFQECFPIRITVPMRRPRFVTRSSSMTSPPNASCFIWKIHVVVVEIPENPPLQNVHCAIGVIRNLGFLNCRDQLVIRLRKYCNKAIDHVEKKDRYQR